MTLLAGLLLPWLAACLLMAALRQYQGHVPHPGRRTRLLGYGFFLGYALLFGLIKAIDGMRGEVPVAWVLAALAVLGALGGGALLRFRRKHRDPGAAQGGTPSTVEQSATPRIRLLAFLMLAWIGAHLVFALADVLSIPVYPWDAWLVWLYRAKAWFFSGGLADVVSRADWLAGGDSPVYTIDAYHYPDFLSVIGLWVALCLGKWSETLVNLPGYLAAVAIALALYGQCLRSKLPTAVAIAAAYLLVSTPLFGAHVSLGGYADLWMAGFAGLGFVALIAGLSARIRSYVVLGLVLIAFSVLVKNEGVVWLLAALGLCWLVCIPFRVQLAASAALALLILVGLAAGITHIDIPALGSLGVKAGELVVPGLGAYALDARNVAPEYLLNFFALGSWHLLWLLVLVTLVIACRPPLRRPQRVVISFLAVFTLSQIVIFAFTDQGEWASTFTAINRLPLHLLPALIFCVALVAGEYLQRAGSRTAFPTARWRVTIAAAVAAGLVTAAGAVLLLRGVPDDPPPPVQPELQFVMGAGERENGTLVVNRFERGMALLSSGVVNFDADHYPILRIALSLPAAADQEQQPAFFWRRSEQDGVVSRFTVHAPGLIDLSEDPDWSGRIVELGLLLPQVGATQVRLKELALEAPGLANQWELTRQGWFSFEPWTLRSINFISGGASRQRLYLPVLVMAWALLTLVLARTPTIGAGSARAVPLATVLLVAWMVLDLRWTWNQARQFGDVLRHGMWLSDEQRLAALPETDVHALIQRFRHKYPQFERQRFLLVGDLYEYEYYLQRAKYLLLPSSALVTERLTERIPRDSADHVMFVGDFAATGTPWAEIRQRLPAGEAWRDRLELVDSENGVLLFSVRR